MNHDRRKLMAVFGLCLSAAIPATAQTDIEEGKDFPGLGRPTGYYINAYDDTEGGAFGFRVAGDDYRQIEGHSYCIQYTLKDGARNPGPENVGRSYASAVAALGGTTVAESMGSVGGSVSANWKANGRSYWVQVDISSGAATYTVNVIEEDTIKAKAEYTAEELEQTLRDTGSASVYGIVFDTGTTTIRPESATVLAVIAEVLGANEELKVEIQGHTANVGDPAANRTLSRERAAAVKDYLVTIHQIPSAQVTTAGLGDSKPAGSNATDEGRTLNRRIELVKKL